MHSQTPAPGILGRFLAIVERGGNALPHPATLFALMAVVIVLVSAVAARLELSAIHPGTGKPVVPVSLLSITGLHRIMTEMVTNFTGFAPLGTVLVAMLGIAVAEGSGLIAAALKLVVLSAPPRALTVAVVFAGIMSNMGGEVGYVLLVPLAAIIFQSVGRHPLAGMAAAFAGVSGGYSANLLLGTVDPLLAGLSEEAARIIDAGYRVNPTANYYFMATSTFLLTALGTLITERVVEPRLGRWSAAASEAAPLTELTAPEKRGLRWAAAATVLLTAVLLWGTLPETGFLRDPQTRDLLRSPFMSGIVSLIFASGALAGLAFGLGAGTVRSDGDVIKAMAKAMETLGAYLVLVFFAAQFVAFFNWTNLGLIVAIKGAELLKSANLGTIPLLVGFVFVSATVNLFMGSASAKWAIMAPVFVPMLMQVGISPELTQAAYRIGDSISNIITPLNPYVVIVLTVMQRHVPRAGIGTLVALMLPYTLAFGAAWTALLLLWMALGLPLGPEGPLWFTPAPLP